MPARRYRIAGRVQGVGYRAFTQRIALGLGLSGWVRNLPDGSVEAVVLGEDGALARFETELRRGPWGARVDSVLSTDAEPPSESDFAIRRTTP